MGHFADFCPEIVGGEQLHINTYKMMGNEEYISSEEEGHGILEDNEANEDPNEENTKEETTEVFEEVKHNVESVSSQNENDWEDISSNNDDWMIISFPSLHGRYERYNDTDVLLDTGSTCLVVKNRKMLFNITSSKKPLREFTSGEHQDCNQEGGFKGFLKFGITPDQR